MNQKTAKRLRRFLKAKIPPGVADARQLYRALKKEAKLGIVELDKLKEVTKHE